MIKDSLKSKIMNSRLFHLQGEGCKIVNCTQVAKKTGRTKKKENKKDWQRNESEWGKASYILSPFPNQWFFLFCFVTPAGRFVKFPLEAHINPPMWNYYSLFIAIKCMEFYCMKMTIYIGNKLSPMSNRETHEYNWMII